MDWGLQTESEGSEQAILSSSEVLEINIDELAQWIFGYRPLEEISGVAPPFWTEYVRTLRGVFLDESSEISRKIKYKKIPRVHYIYRRKRIWMKNGSS